MPDDEDEAQPLACPSCARKYPLSERFCADCGMPLVYVGRGEEQPITEEHERARKVRPEYIGGELVKAGWARNQSEGELIQGILLEEGIPSVQRRTRGFESALAPPAGDASPVRLGAWILVAVAGAFVLVWLLYQLAT